MKRKAITALQKEALRARKRQYGSLSQAELAMWFEEVYKRPIAQSSVAEILSSRYEYLDSALPANGDRKKARKAVNPELEHILLDWFHTMEGKVPLSGLVVKEQAAWFWQRMPQFRDLETPAFSDGWLQGFKERHGIKEFIRHGEAASVDERAIAIEVVSVLLKVDA